MSEQLTACGPMCDRNHTEHERHNHKLCPQAEVHGNPFRYCPQRGCGWTESAEEEVVVEDPLLTARRAARGSEWDRAAALALIAIAERLQ